jgi:membrane protein
MRRVARLLYGAAKDFRRHSCTTLAASLAYFSLLSLFPLVFMVLYLVSFLVSRDNLGYDYLLRFLQEFLPALGGELARGIKRIAMQKNVQWIGVVTSAWFGMLVFHEVQYAVNVVFETPRRRHPVVATVLSAVLLGLVAVLMVLSYVASQIVAFAVDLAPRRLGLDVLALSLYRIVISVVLPSVLTLAATTALYRYLPADAPAWRHAFSGAVVLTVLWEAAKHVFTGYVNSLAMYNRMYGPIVAVVLFLLWVYYSSALFLYGAALVNRLQNGR